MYTLNAFKGRQKTCFTLTSKVCDLKPVNHVLCNKNYGKKQYKFYGNEI